MTKRNLISIIVGAVILFVWNAASWMLPFHSNSLKNIPDNVFHNETMKTEMPESGVYHYPGLPKDNSRAAMQEIERKLNEGPRITMLVYKNGPTKFFDPKTFVFSFLINLLTVIFALFIISKVKLKSTKAIILMTVFIGVVAALVSDISLMNWHLFPLGYTLVNVVDKIIAFGLLGFLFAFYTFRNYKHA